MGTIVHLADEARQPTSKKLESHGWLSAQPSSSALAHPDAALLIRFAIRSELPDCHGNHRGFPGNPVGKKHPNKSATLEALTNLAEQGCPTSRAVLNWIEGRRVANGVTSKEVNRG